MSNAVLEGPITITKWGRDHLVILATDEYHKRQEHKVYGVGELPHQWLDAIKNSKMDSRHDHLNALLED